MRYLLPSCLFALFTLLVSCGGSDEAPAPPVAEAVPVTASFPEAVFTDPAKVVRGVSSTEIMDRLIALVDASPRNSAIYISIFQFEYPALVAALKRADARGVALHIMLDLSREESVAYNPATIDDLKTNLSENAELVVVESDAGSIAINHNKFALFSELATTAGGAKNVVFQTSHNFTLAGTRKAQDAVIIPHQGLYQAYLSYWQDMKKGAQQGMKDYNYQEFHDPAAGVSAFFLPKRRNGEAYGEDAIIELLDKISQPATATVRIGMSDWVSSRMNIVLKLEELLQQGAHLELVVKSSISEDILSGLRALEAKGAFLTVLNMTESSRQKVNIHSKFILIEGVWDGSQTKLLQTGSHNFTHNALRYNNETILLLKDHPLYSQYTSFFEELKSLPGL